LLDALVPKRKQRLTHRRTPSLASLAQRTAGVAPVMSGAAFSRILQDGGIAPKLTHFQRVDDDPNPIDVDFRFPRFAQVDPELYASDHCPILLEIPD
jgi:hypothetical protein